MIIKSFIVLFSCFSLGSPIVAQQLDKGLFSPMVRSNSDTSYGYSVIPDPTGQAPTEFVERFEVRPGDCGAEFNYFDCKNDRERSELRAVKDRIGTRYWYGWSIYIPEDYVNVSPTSTALAQFHQMNAPGFTPAFMFMNIDGGLWVKRYFGRSPPEYKLIGHNEMVGRWTTMEVHAKWGNEGFFRVYVNGDLSWAFSGVTAEYEPYFKYGVYRSHLSRYRNFYKVDDVPTQVVFYANVRQSRTREGLRSGFTDETLPEVGTYEDAKLLTEQEQGEIKNEAACANPSFRELVPSACQ